MKLKDYKPKTAWNQLSDENKQKILDIPITGEVHANNLSACRYYTDMPLMLAMTLEHEFKIPMNRFFELFTVKL